MKYLVIAIALLIAAPVFAEGKKGKPVDSQKSLDFDGDVVEGMNRQPLDSLSTLSENGGGGNKNHLYKRKKKFKPENRELAREIVETY